MDSTMSSTMSSTRTANLHPRTLRLMRELTGPQTSEETRRDHEAVAEILRRARLERNVAVANGIATALAAVINALRRLAGAGSAASSTS